MIKSLYQKKRTVYSLEVFPPKKDHTIGTIYNSLDSMKQLHPDFISVTYGAGGSNSKKTLDIASYIQNDCGIEAVAHLTCAALTPDTLTSFLDALREKKVKNILALRGDMPMDMNQEEFDARHFKHASDLVKVIKKHPLGSIAGACYPEIHPESRSRSEDIHYLKVKEEAGVDFLITQLFFDNDVFYHFMEELRKAEVSLPVSAGIMPITASSQIKRTVELSASRVPAAMSRMLAKYKDSPEDLWKAGIEYAIRQIEDLKAHDVDGIHLYTMNKPKVAEAIYHAVMN